MANKQSAELTEPGVGAFDDPASLIAPEFPAVLVLSVLVVFPVCCLVPAFDGAYYWNFTD